MQGQDQRNHCDLLIAIVEALRRSGYRSLDSQARALGLSRSTAWVIVSGRNKMRLSQKTLDRMRANPELPPAVRAVLESGKLSPETARNDSLNSETGSIDEARYVLRSPKTRA